MKTISTKTYEITEDRLISVIREQGRRLEAQRKEISSLVNIRKRDVLSSSAIAAFRFFLLVLLNKLKIW